MPRPYYIPSFHKGLVDGSAKGKIDEDYKSKCEILTDWYIKPNNNVATRPGRKAVDVGLAAELYDITYKNNKRFVLGKPAGIKSGYNSDVSLFKTFLESTYTSRETTENIKMRWSPKDTQEWEQNIQYTNRGEIDQVFIDVYDNNNGNFEINKESSYYIISVKPEQLVTLIETLETDGSVANTYDTDSTSANHTLSDTRIKNLSQLLLLFNIMDREKNSLVDYDPLNADGYVEPTSSQLNTQTSFSFHLDAPSVTTIDTPYIEQSRFCNAAGDLHYTFVFKNPYDRFEIVYAGVSNLPKIDTSFDIKHGNIRHSLVNSLKNPFHASNNTYGYNSGSTLSIYLNNNVSRYIENISFSPHISNNVDLPKQFEEREIGVGLSMYGLSFSIDEELICDNSGNVSLTPADTKEENMNTFAEVIDDKNIDDLPIVVNEYIPAFTRKLSEITDQPSYPTQMEWNDDVSRYSEFGYSSEISVDHSGRRNMGASPIQYTDQVPSSIISNMFWAINNLFGADISDSANCYSSNSRVFIKRSAINIVPANQRTFPSNFNRNISPDVSALWDDLDNCQDIGVQSSPLTQSSTIYRITDFIIRTSTGVRQFKYKHPSGSTAEEYLSLDDINSLEKWVARYEEVKDTDEGYIILLEDQQNTDMYEIKNTAGVATGYYKLKVPTEVKGQVSELENFIDENPEFRELKDFLKPSLIIEQSDKNDKIPPYPDSTVLLSILPDIKIEEIGSDISKEGTFLFSLPNGDNVFIGASLPLYYKVLDKTSRDQFKQVTSDPELNNPLSPYNIKNRLIDDLSDDDFAEFDTEFPQGTGGTFGRRGVTLYVQRGNRLSEGGIPVYCQIPGGDIGNIHNPENLLHSLKVNTADRDYITTIKVLDISVNYSDSKYADFINNMKYVSFYGLDGENKAITNGLIKVGDASVNNQFLDEFSSSFLYKGIIKSTTSPVVVSSMGTITTDPVLNLFLDMARHDLDYSEYCAQYITNKEIDISPDNFPNTYVKESTTTSVLNLISEFGPDMPAESKNKYLPIPYLLNTFVNNYLYPLEPLTISSNINTQQLKDDISELEKHSETLFEITEVVGGLISYNGIVLSSPSSFDSFEPVATYTRDFIGPFNRGRRRTGYRFEREFGTSPNLALVSVRDPYNFPNLAYINRIEKKVSRVLYYDSSSIIVDDLRDPTIVYDLLSVYVNNSDISFTDINGKTFNLNRDNIFDILQDKKELLAETEKSIEQKITDTYFKPYSTKFKVYHDPQDLSLRLGRRFLQSDKGIIYLSSSQENKENIFSVGYKDYLSNNWATSTKPDYLRNSEIPTGDIIRNSLDPSIIRLNSKFGDYIIPTDIVDVSQHKLLVTNQKVYNYRETATITPQIDEILDSGYSTDIIADSSIIVGGDDNIVKVSRYFEDAKGFVDEIVNDDLRFNASITSVASLISKHGLIFFSLKNDDNIYVLTIGKKRDIKGFSKFSVNNNVEKMINVNNDKVGFLTQTRYYEFDFSNTNSLEDEFLEIGGSITTSIPIYRLKTMPLLELGDTDFSPNRIANIKKVIMGVSGNPEFNLNIINSLDGSKRAEKPYRRTNSGDIIEDVQHSGHILIDGIPPNGCELPQIEIVKDDGNYLEISSMTVLMG